MVDLNEKDITGMIASIVVALIMIGILAAWALPEKSALRDADTGSLTKTTAPLMAGIVPLIFFLFAIPGMVHGFVVGTFKSHRDVIKAMSKSMETMGYYLVLVFFAALFIASFTKSNIGSWLAVSGAEILKQSGAPVWLILVGIIILTSMVNLLIGSASAKWAMLSPIFVPMMMIMGISPEMTQAAYRIGDSTTNIITPMMPYFPLVVVFCQKYVKNTGIGTVVSMMLPYSLAFLFCWSIYLMIYWQSGFQLGPDVKYDYVP
jgi:aminobenzoyl-glutamate transport protein